MLSSGSMLPIIIVITLKLLLNCIVVIYGMQVIKKIFSTRNGLGQAYNDLSNKHKMRFVLITMLAGVIILLSRHYLPRATSLTVSIAVIAAGYLYLAFTTKSMGA